MDQSAALYTHAPTAALLAPWLAEQLPQLDPTVRHRLVQLVAGLVEHHSVLIEQIARSSAFRATPESNGGTCSPSCPAPTSIWALTNPPIRP